MSASGSATVTVISALTAAYPFTETVILAVPTATAVTLPLASTVATAVSLEAYSNSLAVALSGLTAATIS